MKLSKSHIKQVSSLSVMQLVLAVCAYATQMRLTHEISIDELGRLAYGLAIGLWLQVVVRLAYDRTLVRSIFNCKNDPVEVQFILFSSLVWRGIFFVVISLALVLLLQDYYVAMIALSMAIVGLDIYPWFDSYGHTTIHAKIQVVGKFFYFIPIWIAVASGALLDINVIAFLLLASSICVLTLQFVFWVRLADYPECNFSYFLKRFEFTLSAIRTQFALMVVTLLSLATWRFPDLYMGIQSEYGALAGYAVILQVITFLLNISDQHLRMVRVRLADAGVNGLHYSSRYFIVECLLFAVLLSIIGLVAAEVSIHFLLPESYKWISDLVVFIPIFLILYSINGLYGILVILMYADKSYAKAVFWGAVVTGIFSIILIPLLGALGAFLSLVVGFFVSTLLQIKNVESIFSQREGFLKRKILFYYYAEGNFGDDLMWSAVCSKIDPADYSLLYGKGFVAPPEFAGEVVTWRQLVFRFWQYDRLCIFGGSMFMDSTNAQRKALVKLFILNFFFKCDRIAIAGINIEPLKSSLSRWAVAFILRRAGFVWFRDNKSAADFYDFSASRVCFVGGDMAFNTNTHSMFLPTCKGPLSEYFIGVVINPISEAVILKVLREKIESLISEGFFAINVKFLSFQETKQEQDSMSRLRSAILSGRNYSVDIRCECMSYQPGGGFKIVFDFYAESDFVIAGRFHGVILSLITQTAYCPVVYADKFTSYLSDLYINNGCAIGSVLSSEKLASQLAIGNESVARLKAYLN